MAAALRVLGPTPVEHVVDMLKGLRLSDSDARAAVAHGLASEMFVEHRGNLVPK